MAGEVTDNTQNIPDSGLGAYIENIRKETYTDNNEQVPGIPANFINLLKESNTHLKTIITTLTTTGKGVEDELSSITDALEKQTAGILKLDKSFAVQQKTPATVAAKATDETDTAEEALATPTVQEVSIVDIKTDAFQKLERLFSKLNISTKAIAAPAQTAALGAGRGFFGDLFDTIKKFIGYDAFKAFFTSDLVKKFLEPLKNLLFNPATGLIASLAMGIASWFDTGPFKGVKELVSKIGIAKFGEAGLKLLSEKFTSWATKLLPEAGEVLIKETLGIGTKAGIKGILGKAAGAIGKFLGKAAKFVPFIGTIIDVGSGISRMMKGDYLGGIIDFTAAVANLVPGAGTAISIGLSLINAFRDISSGGVEQEAKSQTNVNIKEFFGKAYDWLKTKIVGYFERRFKNFLDGIRAFQKGEYGKALVSWASAVPTIGWMVDLFDWATTDITEDSVLYKSTGFVLDIWDKVKEAVSTKYEALKHGVTDFFTGFGESISSGIQRIADWFLDSAKAANQTIQDFIEDPIDSLKRLWEKIQDIAKSIIEAPLNMVKSGWKKVTSFFSKIVNIDTSEETKTDVKLPAVPVNLKESIAKTKAEAVVPNVAAATKAAAPVAQITPTKIERVVPQTSEKVVASQDVSQQPLSYEQYMESQAVTPTSSLKAIKSVPQPFTPLDIPLIPTPTMAMNDMSKHLAAILQHTQRHQKVEAPKSSNTSVSSAHSSSISSNTNVFTNTIDRDIPYIERNKYRQTIVYDRALL